jgi:hypothetical protein
MLPRNGWNVRWRGKKYFALLLRQTTSAQSVVRNCEDCFRISSSTVSNSDKFCARNARNSSDDGVRIKARCLRLSARLLASYSSRTHRIQSLIHLL